MKHLYSKNKKWRVKSAILEVDTEHSFFVPVARNYKWYFYVYTRLLIFNLITQKR